MSARWSFTAVGNKVYMQARMEGHKGMVGDVQRELAPGMEFRGLTFAELKKAGGGVVTVGSDGKAKIE